MRVRFVHVAAVLALSTPAFAQADPPRGTATTTIAGQTVTVDYGQPALKGRTMDALLDQLPADRIWRAGENQVTTLTTGTDLLIAGKKVAAGKYSVYVYAPQTGAWALVLNTDAGKPLGELWAKAPDAKKNAPWPHLEGYQNIASTEVVRAPIASGTTNPPAEEFTIAFKPAGKGADMTLSWGDRSWSLDIQPAK